MTQPIKPPQKLKKETILTTLRKAGAVKKVFVLGCSITAGSGANIDLNLAYAVLFPNALSRLGNLSGYAATKSGWAGYNMGQLISDNKVNNIPTDTTVGFLECCILNEHGGNRNITTQTLPDLKTILTAWRVRCPNARLVVIGSPPRLAAPAGGVDYANTIGKYQSDYNTAIRDWCKDNGYEFIDVYADFAPQMLKFPNLLYDTTVPQGVYFDITHPNEAGYLLMSNTILKYITGSSRFFF